LRGSEVANLEKSVSGYKQVFGLEIPMCDADIVKVFDAANQLLEIAICFLCS
jgi:hypothetical protein